MTTLARGQGSSPSVPLLSTFIVSGGVLVDPAVVEYAIFQRVDSETTAQVFPSTLGARATVDIGDLVDGGDRLGAGWYAARWAVPLDALVGRYEIRWWHRAEEDDDIESSYTEEFEVVSSVRSHGRAYGLVADLRAEGIAPARIADAELHAKLVRATQLFERYTGRTFAPTYKTVRADGSGTGVLRMNEPIIAVQAVYLDGDRVFVEGAYGQDLSILRVYNRHLEGLTDPDDRESPRIEYSRSAAFDTTRFVRGRQNVTVRGLFGYTDLAPFGAPAGVTPELVKHAVRLLVMKDLPRLGDTAARDDAQKRWRLTGESTRDQSYTMFGGVDAATRGALVGGVTGDPEVDNIIIMFRRPPSLGAA